MGLGGDGDGEGEGEGVDKTHLLHSTLPSSSSSSIEPLKPSLKRTGNLWTAFAHIITALVGSGVLSLAWSIAQLGWIAGPLSLLFFASIALVSAFLVTNCYKSPDSDNGPTRNRSFLEAVQMILGKRSASLCSILIRLSMFKGGIVYTVTSGISMRAIQKSNCYHKEGHEAACEYGTTSYMLLFGIIQIVMCQIPDFHDMGWLSTVATIMSFCYAIIGSALGLAKLIGNGYIKGDIVGVSTSTATQKVLLVSQALGDIAFAYPFSVILLEIQDTLKSPPSEKVTMKKASVTATCITTIFYICCGGFGYAAFGNSAPGNLLTGFGFYEPYWLIDFANVCVSVHLVGSYLLYSQPVFAIVERWAAEKYPNSGFVNNNYILKIPLLPAFRSNLFRLCFRTTYVASTTSVAIIFPYFNQVLGVAGTLTAWPLDVYFPVEMYITQKNVGRWTRKWIVLRVYSIIYLLVTTFALIGSVGGLISAKFS
ncbi:putative amino acid permease 7 [Camellia lanceoleosa]|uniref:Amino acid permease 7 n=1 Tax=Camellia lanceoleosa TaxID=1840588 RepID=A0ACC0HNE3_9ERIC|nr:putative amino acid permease 7 [Camellia lanceoleosa]